MTQQNISALSCEQVYSLWVSEPYLITIFDLRGPVAFSESHIPGAICVDQNQLDFKLANLENKLAVIIATEDQEARLNLLLVGKKNFVFMSNCFRWSELNYPITSKQDKSLLSFVKNLKEGEPMRQEIIFHQLFEAESSTYTYLIADSKSKEAAIIDPVLETVERDLKLIEEWLEPIYIFQIHIHADHITGAGEIRKRTSAKTGVSQEAEVSCVDIPLEDGQELILGDKMIKIIATPGHTNTCLTYLFENMIFTGDALLIRGCGRTDFQQGNSDTLFESVRSKLFLLPDKTIIYPGHDYRGQTSSTIGSKKI